MKILNLTINYKNYLIWFSLFKEISKAVKSSKNGINEKIPAHLRIIIR